MLHKGQASTRYYRWLTRGGGWVWVQSYATIVHNSRSSRPHCIVAVNYVISGREAADMILNSDQIPGVSSSGGVTPAYPDQHYSSTSGSGQYQDYPGYSEPMGETMYSDQYSTGVYSTGSPSDSSAVVMGGNVWLSAGNTFMERSVSRNSLRSSSSSEHDSSLTPGATDTSSTGHYADTIVSLPTTLSSQVLASYNLDQIYTGQYSDQRQEQQAKQFTPTIQQPQNKE